MTRRKATRPGPLCTTSSLSWKEKGRRERRRSAVTRLTTALFRSLQAQVLGGRRGDGFREVRGEEAVEYLFVIPEDFAPRRARVRALVANDYRIEVAQQHPFFDALRNQFTPRNRSFETRVRAAGEVRDFSNRRAVEFELWLFYGSDDFRL